MPIKDVSIICDWNSILLLNTYAVVLGGLLVVFTVVLADLGGGEPLVVRIVFPRAVVGGFP